MFKQNEKSIAQIAEYIPRACRGMQLQEAKARLEKKIALYINDGCDASVLNAAFAPALNSHTFFVHRSADPQRRQPVSKIDYQALREAAQNYQSMLAWYQEKPDSPNAEQDCDAALAAFKREIRHREVDIIADLLDELEEVKQRIDEQESRTVKLPEPFKLAKSSSGLTYYYADEVNAALTAAGIRIEGE